MQTNNTSMHQRDRFSSDFPTLLNALAQPGAFPFALPGDEPITVLQTHASAVLLAAHRAYKLKKPINLGFLNFSTPALRRHFCGQEVLLNQRLAPHIYLGVAPVLLSHDGRLRFGSTFAPAEVPMPDALIGGDTVVDYAVVMVHLPEEATLESRVRAGTASPALLSEIARSLAAFHAAIPTNEHIASFGTLQVIGGNWKENFEQMRPYIGRTLDARTYERISSYIHRFLEQRTALFTSRVRDGSIRDCHGDLRLQHVYLLNAPTDQAPSIAILDGIEFNERFRYSDVACEVAFLAMELDAAGRPDLSRAFITSYVAASGDDALCELLPFYMCYRACVRGKVTSFQLDEAEVPAAQRERARELAAALFRLAADYTDGPTRQMLLLIGGLMGTGKSTLALALQQELGWTLFSSDTLRKRLARLDPTQPQAAAFGQGVYSQQWTARTYAALVQEAGKALADGRSVVLDATFLHRADRQAAARTAAALGIKTLFVECVCPQEVAHQRLAQRWQARLAGTQERASRASDARPDLYAAQAEAWENFVADEERDSEHVIIPTTQPLAASLRHILDALHGEGLLR